MENSISLSIVTVCDFLKEIFCLWTARKYLFQSVFNSSNGSVKEGKVGGPFQCINCQKNFRHADEFILHKRIHIGERIFS